jgi:hypothetical protein
MNTKREIEWKINFWNGEVYPVLEGDTVFTEWVKVCIPKIVSPILGSTPYRDISDITFSILDKKEKVNPSRLYIGFFSLSPRDYEMFLYYAENFIGKDIREFFKTDKVIGFGLGVDRLEKEKRAYIGYIENDKLYLQGLTFINKTLIEDKTYLIMDTKTVYMTGERGIRLQANYRLTGLQAQFFTFGLDISDKTKQLISKLVKAGFYLDTISYSPQRGIGLYFD